MKPTSNFQLLTSKIRPTKKQFQTLSFVQEFIADHGYSPSYREIMQGCNYTSVATVALHINSLIKRGHLVKRNRSARSLELAAGGNSQIPAATAKNPSHEKWLVSQIEARFKKLEKGRGDSSQVDNLYVLVGS